MNVRDFTAIIIRLFGLWLLFQCIFAIEQTISVKFMESIDVHGQAYNRLIFFAHIFNDVLYALSGAVLVWKPYLVADRVSPQRTIEGQIRLSTTNLTFLCFSVAGLVFTVEGVRNLIYYVGTYLFAPDSIIRGDDQRSKAAILSNVFQVMAGCGFCLDSSRSFAVFDGRGRQAEDWEWNTRPKRIEIGTNLNNQCIDDKWATRELIKEGFRMTGVVI